MVRLGAFWCAVAHRGTWRRATARGGAPRREAARGGMNGQPGKSRRRRGNDGVRMVVVGGGARPHTSQICGDGSGIGGISSSGGDVARVVR